MSPPFCLGGNTMNVDTWEVLLYISAYIIVFAVTSLLCEIFFLYIDKHYNLDKWVDKFYKML